MSLINTGGGIEAPPAGGGGDFSPADVSGLIYWADPSQETGLTDGALVGSVTDWSGGGHTGTAAGGARPSYQTNEMNGLPVFRFDGTDDTVSIPRHASLEPTTISMFMIFRATTPGAFGYLLSKSRTAGTDTSYGIQCNGTNDLRSVIFTATTGNVVGTAVTVVEAFDGITRLWCATANGSVLTEYLNGCSDAAGATSTAVGNLDYTTENLYLGSIGGSSLFAAYDLGEVLLYSGALSVADRWKVTGYLAGKWGVT